MTEVEGAQHNPPRGPELGLLFAVLAAALVLRVWGAFFGLPFIYHLDEGFEVYRALRLANGEFDLERWGKGGYYLVLFVEYGVYFLISLATGAVSSAAEFADSFVADPSPFWKIGRLTTAVLGTLTVFVVWRHGRRVGGPLTGLLAAAFLCVSFTHVEESHYITVNVPMTLFTFWALAMIAEDVQGIRKLNPYLFVVVSAFAVACKIPAIILFVPYFAASLLRGGLRGERGLLTRATLLPAVGAGLLFLVLNPAFVAQAERVLRFVAGMGRTYSQAAGEAVDVERVNLWAYYSDVILTSQGVVMVALSGAGVALALRQRNKALAMHILFGIVFFSVISFGAGSGTYGDLYYARYVVPLLPVLALLAAWTIRWALERSRLRGAPLVTTAAGLCLLACLEPGLRSIELVRRLARTDTRSRAVEWIEQNIPEGSRILVQGNPDGPAQLRIPLENSTENVQAIIARLERTDPGKALYWRTRLRVRGRRPTYDLVTVRPYKRIGSLEAYRDRGVDYVVLRPDRFAAETVIDPSRQSRIRFYDALRAGGGVRRIGFDPEADDAPGPPLEVWQINPLLDP